MTVLVIFLSVFKDSISFVLFYVLADQASCALSSISQHQFVPTKTQSHQREWLEIWYAVGLYAWLYDAHQLSCLLVVMSSFFFLI